jgi:hypothetical protein
MNEGARELVIARAEQAESNAEDVFFDNCKFEGTREQRRIFQAGWRCGQDYGESLFLNPESFGVVYPPHYAENQSRAFDPTKDTLIDWDKLKVETGLKEKCGFGDEASGD